MTWLPPLSERYVGLRLIELRDDALYKPKRRRILCLSLMGRSTSIEMDEGNSSGYFDCDLESRYRNVRAILSRIESLFLEE